MDDRETPDVLVAEHGFSTLVTVRGGEREQTILFDTGTSPDGLVQNLHRLQLSPKDFEAIVLSHGHARIVNIVRYAQKLTGVQRVYAVLGGFHLGGQTLEPVIPRVCEAFAEFAPEVIAPAHCTGWRAIHALAAAFPDAFIQNSVGTRYEFAATVP